MKDRLPVVSAIPPESAAGKALAEYARRCSWKAGVRLAEKMERMDFDDGDAVFGARLGERFIGSCTLTRHDCFEGLSDFPYAPFVGFLFVEESFRGQGLGFRLVETAMARAREVGWKYLFLASTHVGLYEKIGFHPIDVRVDAWGQGQRVFRRPVG